MEANVNSFKVITCCNIDKAVVPSVLVGQLIEKRVQRVKYPYQTTRTGGVTNICSYFWLACVWRKSVACGCTKVVEMKMSFGGTFAILAVLLGLLLQSLQLGKFIFASLLVWLGL